MNLDGKSVAVLGVADESSIAWGIARAFAEHGARVSVGYQHRFFSRVRLLLREFPSIQGERCDVTRDEELAAFFDRFRQEGLDALVHAVAFGPPEIFTEYPSEVSAEAFAHTQEISTRSLATVVRHAKPHLREWASVITLSFQASTRAVPLYGMMGVAKASLESLLRYLAMELGPRRIRVNAISPGMVETPAFLGELLAFIRNPKAPACQRSAVLATAAEKFLQAGAQDQDEVCVAKAVARQLRETFSRKSAIEETVSQEDVADCAVFLASDFSRKITGQVIHVDCGLSSSLIL